MPSNEETRREKLVAIKQYLLGERNFAIASKDWPRVTVFRQKLRQYDEHFASLVARKAI